MPLSGPKIISLMGPTACGKTALALEIAQKIPCEIISVDSVMIYKGMDIGSAKPSEEELAIAPHHLINIRDPVEVYSAAAFCADAKQLIEAILSRGCTPLLVGGTMMYFYALQFGLSQLPQADDALRAQLKAVVERDGLLALHEQLKKVDPESAALIKPQDSQRIQRAMEVYQLTGKPMSEVVKESMNEPLPYELMPIAVTMDDREALHQRIAGRFRQMLKDGFIEEVEVLYQREDLHQDLPSIRSVGYRQVWQYLAGEYDYATMEERAIIATRQLAKRQFTWLRNRWPKVPIISHPIPDAGLRDGFRWEIVGEK